MRWRAGYLIGQLAVLVYALAEIVAGGDVLARPWPVPDYRPAGPWARAWRPWCHRRGHGAVALDDTDTLAAVCSRCGRVLTLLCEPDREETTP